MKKHLSALLALILLLGCVLALTSCAAKPELDLDKAKEALEKNGYTAIKTGGALEGLTGVGATLTAFDDNFNFLTIIYTDKADQVDAEMEKAKKEMADLKKDIDEEIAELRDELKESDLTAEEKKEIEDAIKEADESLAKIKSCVYGKADGVIWYGTADAIKATK